MELCGNTPEAVIKDEEDLQIIRMLRINIPMYRSRKRGEEFL